MRTRDVFIKAGFEEDWDVMTDVAPGYFYDFGNTRLYAAQVMTMRLQQCFLLSGTLADKRSIKSVQSELLLTVDSYEQGIALIAYAVGVDFQPLNSTQWLEMGRKYEDLLPWVQSRKEYEARPRCLVERDWLRIAIKKLGVLVVDANDSDKAVFDFDGEIFGIKFRDSRLAFPAAGEAWGKSYCVGMENLVGLPKRLSRETIVIDVWDGYLGIDGRALSVRENCE